MQNWQYLFVAHALYVTVVSNFRMACLLLLGAPKAPNGDDAPKAPNGDFLKAPSGTGTNNSLVGVGVSYKRQHYAQRLRRFDGTVQALLERCIQPALADRLFRLLVLQPLDIEPLEHANVRDLSGGQLQRVAIALCLGQPATVYLLDEPSAGLDCEQRIAAARVIRRWVVGRLQRTAFVIEHDFVMASALADRVIVFSGEPGVECTAHAAAAVSDGFNMFLRQLDVTIRRDSRNWRPRVNRRGCVRHREQVAADQ